MKLTYRDKILLIGAVVVIIWAIGIFVIIKPAFTTMNQTSNTKDSKDNEIVILEQRVENEKNIKDELKKAYEDAVEHTDEYFYKLEPKDVATDNIRELLLSSGREVVNTSYSIDDFTSQSISVYSTTPEVNDDYLGQQISIIEGTSDGLGVNATLDPNANVSAYTVGAYTVNSDFKCDLDNLLTFSDEILTTAQKSFIITSVNITNLSESEVEGDMSFTYYMAREVPVPAALADEIKAESKDKDKDKDKDDSSEK